MANFKALNSVFEYKLSTGRMKHYLLLPTHIE